MGREMRLTAQVGEFEMDEVILDLGSDVNVLTKPFHVHVDASGITLGIVLTQPGEGDIDHPIAYSSRKLSTVEKNYTTTEREGLAMVYAL